MKFSQRNGYLPAQKLVQFESVDNELRAGLWSALSLSVWRTHRVSGHAKGYYSELVRGSSMQSLAQAIWIDFYKIPIDTMPSRWTECLKIIRERYFKYSWFEILDFVEFVAKNRGDSGRFLARDCNDHFEKENSGYRFVSLEIAPISSNAEVQEVEEASNRIDGFAGATEHIRTALGLLSDRDNPDFRNTVKESISAVESAAKEIANDRNATLGQVLKELERANGLHPALKSGFSSLYGFTSDASGIRHAIMEAPSVTRADAKFMLVACSAFVNFLAETLSVERDG